MGHDHRLRQNQEVCCLYLPANSQDLVPLDTVLLEVMVDLVLLEEQPQVMATPALAGDRLVLLEVLYPVDPFQPLICAMYTAIPGQYTLRLEMLRDGLLTTVESPLLEEKLWLW